MPCRLPLMSYFLHMKMKPLILQPLPPLQEVEVTTIPDNVDDDGGGSNYGYDDGNDDQLAIT